MTLFEMVTTNSLRVQVNGELASLLDLFWDISEIDEIGIILSVPDADSIVLFVTFDVHDRFLSLQASCGSHS